MVWVVPLSDTDLSTHALTPRKHFIVFGVHLSSVGGEAPLPNW